MFNLKPRRTRRQIKGLVSPATKVDPSRRDRLKHPVRSGIKSVFASIKKPNQ